MHIGFFGALALLLIALKLLKYIDWSWWWVLSPLLGASLIFVIFITFFAIVMYFVSSSD